MLPVETFADVASFLAYYDLDGLKLASKTLSAVANQCADAIRLFDFSDLQFEIWDFVIRIWRRDSGERLTGLCGLKFESDKDMAEFISEAFRNCSVRRIQLLTIRKRLLDAFKLAANSFIVSDLRVCGELAKNVAGLIEFADSFRRVEVLQIFRPRWTLDEEESFKEFCQMKKIVYARLASQDAEESEESGEDDSDSDF